MPEKSTKVTSFQSGKVVDNEPKKGYGCCGTLIVIFMYIVYILLFPITFYFWSASVSEYQRAVILRLGRIRSKGAKGPGFFVKFPIDDVRTVDLRIHSHVIVDEKRRGQDVLTKDSVSIEVYAVCFYRVVDPVAAVVNVEDYKKAVQRISATTVKNTLGMKTLEQIMQGQESLNSHMQGVLDSVTEEWGVKVERIGLKEIILPGNIQRAMAAIAEERRAAKARIITAKAEEDASSILRRAADKLTENQFALQLRTLQTLTRVATEHMSNIIFPIPMDMLSNISHKPSYVKPAIPAP